MGTGDRIERALRDGGDDGLADAAERVAERAKANMPIGDPAEDPAPAIALRENVHITPHGLGYIVSVDTVYAAKQHEDQRLKHPRSGGPKFLERALIEVMPSLEAIIASKVNARMRSGLASDPSRPHR